MFPTNGTSDLTIDMSWPRVKSHVVIFSSNTILQIARILVMRPISRRPRMIAQLVGAVVDAAVDAVVDAKGTTRSIARSIIIRMEIDIIKEIVFKRGSIIECSISVVKSVDEILPTPLDFMLLGSVILAIFPCHLTMTSESCQGRLLVLQLALENLREVEREPHTNAIRLFLK